MIVQEILVVLIMYILLFLIIDELGQLLGYNVDVVCVISVQFGILIEFCEYFMFCDGFLVVVLGEVLMVVGVNFNRFFFENVILSDVVICEVV